uniref:PAAR domain-containing protein n=1 Tax=Halomonas sp. TaxID=1486246 RepID=UPI00261BA863|nr:PAAR domain-containing protein [Halomonas sp.]
MLEINGVRVARVGDTVECNCPGGPHTLVTGDKDVLIHDQPMALLGDRSSCGATVEQGMAVFLHRALDVAYDGCRMSCGGHVRITDDEA